MNLAACLEKFRVLWACLLALALGAGLIAASGASPWRAYGALFSGAFLDYWGFASTLVKTSPILLAALAVAVPLRTATPSSMRVSRPIFARIIWTAFC